MLIALYFTAVVALASVIMVASHIAQLLFLKKESLLAFVVGFVVGCITLHVIMFDYWGIYECAALALYGAVAIAYIEIRFLLSRGISTRVMVDLLERGGYAMQHDLTSVYGQGMGVSGLLKKRIRSLVNLHLVKADNTWVGPLTGVGSFLTHIFGMARRILGLRMVG